jgi:hypothetical protein
MQAKPSISSLSRTKSPESRGVKIAIEAQETIALEGNHPFIPLSA